MFEIIFRYWKMENEAEIANMEDVVFDITITGPYPDLNLSDIPGLNTFSEELARKDRAIIERYEKIRNHL